MNPILCNYYVTNRCNARCQFCDIWHHPRYRAVPDCSLQDVFNNLNQLKNIGIRFVDFTGGEPLLHPDLSRMVQYAKKIGLKTSVTTNCFLYDKYAESLQGMVDFLHFSLDSMDAETHNRLRGVKSFHHVMNSIDRALSLGEKPDLLFTVTHSNYQDIADLSRFAARKKIMLIVNPVFSYSGQDRISIQALDYIEQYRSRPYVYMNLALHRLIRQGGNDRRRPRCRAVSSTIVISPDNQLILPCFHLAKRQLPIKGSISEMLNSAIYKQLKENQGRYSECHGCTINCYFDPSFTHRVDSYFGLSLLSKAKFVFNKYMS